MSTPPGAEGAPPTPAAGQSSDRPRRTPSRLRATMLVGVLAVLAAASAGAWWYFGAGPRGSTSTDGREPAAAFVGAQACAGCHPQEHARWAESDHARAMQVASETTVLGDFADRRFAHGRVSTTFFRRDGRFMVRTDGPDGKLHDFEIKYTFGVGRCSSICRAARRAPAGAGDRLGRPPGRRAGSAGSTSIRTRRSTFATSSTGPAASRTGTTCARTATRRTSARTTTPPPTRYATTWSEINVACEACHGPGSATWPGPGTRAGRTMASTTKGLDGRARERRGARGPSTRRRATAKRSAPRPPGRRSRRARSATPAAARSHRTTPRAGRSSITHRRAPLGAALLRRRAAARRGLQLGLVPPEPHARAGVTCSDCHEPHSEKLRAPGNEVCAQCHAPAKYDDATHHFHAPARRAPSASAATCRPHATWSSIRATTTACGAAAGSIGRVRRAQRVHALSHRSQARLGGGTGADLVRPGPRRLSTIRRGVPPCGDGRRCRGPAARRDSPRPAQPAIVRASALTRLPGDLARSPAGVDAARQALGDADPLVRAPRWRRWSPWRPTGGPRSPPVA